MANYYCSSVAYTAVAQFATTTAYTLGQIVRQLAAPSVGNERCFRCTTPGTSGGAESAWTLTRNGTTAQGTATFTECTGQETYQGTTWAAPYARLATATNTTFTAAGDTTFVSADHAETQTTSITLNSPGTLASPTRIICVTRPSSAIPPVVADQTTGATVTTTSTGDLSLDGTFYMYGVSFSCRSGAAGSAALNLGANGACGQIFDRCGFSMPSTSGSSSLTIGAGTSSHGANDGAIATWRNVTVSFGTVGCKIIPSKKFLWDGGTLTGTGPTTLFSSPPCGPIEIRNVDLSTIGAAQNIVTLSSSTPLVPISINNCKLNASLGGVLSGSIPAYGDGGIDVIISDSSTSTSREEHYSFSGSVIADLANYLTAGASDGTTHKSWKMASNASANFFRPLMAPDIFQWVATTGSHTFSLYLSTLTGTLKDSEFGFDIEYMGSASTPQGTLDTTCPLYLSTGSNLAPDTQAWTGQGGITKLQVTKTVTINEKGWVRITPRLNKASQTVWVDPLVVVS